MKPKPVIIGLDECGMGELAGPMVLCVFSCPDSYLDRLKSLGACDSKTTTRESRETFAREVTLDRMRGLLDFEIIWSDASDLDRIPDRWAHAGIQATHLLRNRLDPRREYPTILQIDGRSPLPNTSIRDVIQEVAPGFDSSSLRVGAASILAKRSIDAYWDLVDETYPGWDFRQHCGAASPHHIEMLLEHGPLFGIHRRKAVDTLMKTLARGGGPRGFKFKPGAA